jgi:hypothetical protein
VDVTAPITTSPALTTQTPGTASQAHNTTPSARHAPRHRHRSVPAVPRAHATDIPYPTNRGAHAPVSATRAALGPMWHGFLLTSHLASFPLDSARLSPSASGGKGREDEPKKKLKRKTKPHTQTRARTSAGRSAGGGREGDRAPSKPAARHVPSSTTWDLCVSDTGRAGGWAVADLDGIQCGSEVLTSARTGPGDTRTHAPDPSRRDFFLLLLRSAFSPLPFLAPAFPSFLPPLARFRFLLLLLAAAREGSSRLPAESSSRECGAPARPGGATSAPEEGRLRCSRGPRPGSPDSSTGSLGSRRRGGGLGWWVFRRP